MKTDSCRQQAVWWSLPGEADPVPRELARQLHGTFLVQTVGSCSTKANSLEFRPVKFSAQKMHNDFTEHSEAKTMAWKQSCFCFSSEKVPPNLVAAATFGSKLPDPRARLFWCAFLARLFSLIMTLPEDEQRLNFFPWGLRGLPALNLFLFVTNANVCRQKAAKDPHETQNLFFLEALNHKYSYVLQKSDCRGKRGRQIPVLVSTEFCFDLVRVSLHNKHQKGHAVWGMSTNFRRSSTPKPPWNCHDAAKNSFTALVLPHRIQTTLRRRKILSSLFWETSTCAAVVKTGLKRLKGTAWIFYWHISM